MPATLGELATRFGCKLEGAGSILIERVATLANAGGDSVSFLANPLYRPQLANTKAAAVILDEPSSAAFSGAKLVSDNPYATYARIASYLHPSPRAVPGVHPSACIAPDADVSPDAEIGPLVSIGARARIRAGVIVGAGCAIGAEVAIGEHTRLAPRVTLLDRVSLGARCVVHSGAVIGSDGYGFAQDGAAWVKVPQLGAVEIGDDVEIGANTTIDRGTIESTVIENGVKLDNLVQIAHNVRLGEHTVMAAMSGAAGSTKIGKRCMIGGGVVMINHLTICDDVMFLFRSVVTKSVTEPGVYAGTLPAQEASAWRRNAARFKNIDTMNRRIQALERSLAGTGKLKKE